MRFLKHIDEQTPAEPENGLLAGVSTMKHFLELSEEEWDFDFRVKSKDRFRKG